jgi:hypothetical protein
MFNEIHETNKEKYATILRSLFSNPEMLNNDGSINQEFVFTFLTQKIFHAFKEHFQPRNTGNSTLVFS